MIRVLLAEDDPFSNLLLQRVLKKWGFEPVSFHEGKAALQALLRPDGPPIALLDWFLPGMDGPVICETVRRQRNSRELYLIMLTANTDQASQKAALEKGADVYLPKPIDFEQLFAQLQTAKQALALEE